MANWQLPRIDKIQLIQPKDFNITWGDDVRYWRLPNESDQSAELLQVCFLRVEAEAKINPFIKNRIRISFDVSATQDYHGFKSADVRIGAKIGAAEHYVFIKISLDGLVTNERKTVHAEFDVEANPRACLCSSCRDTDTTLHFGLFDTWTSHWKYGVIFHEARVTIE